MKRIVVDTDIILEHVVRGVGPSVLRALMNEFFCYTTVFNAAEAFSTARSEREVQALDDAMSAMKVLGVNSKSAKTIGRVLSRADRRPGTTLLVFAAGVCIESKLPIVTLNLKRYSRIKRVRVVPARILLQSGRARRAVSIH